MNNITITGNLCKEPELKYTKDGVAVATFNLAVKRTKEITDFMYIKLWRKQAETAAEYLKKGKQVAITGSYYIDQYEKDGKKESFHYINGYSFEMLGKKED